MVYASAYWKMKAREALKDHWLVGLLIALVVNLPALLVQGIASATGNDLMIRLQEALYGAVNAGSGAVDESRLMDGLQGILGSAGIWVMQGLSLLAWLLTPCLTLGMTAWILGRLRKQEDPGVGAVFSRMGLFWKGIGLRLYVTWRVFLYMLPGIVLSILSMLPLWLSDRSSRISVLSAANTAIGLQTVSLVAAGVLGAVAALKYTLSDMYLADHPEMGAVQAAKASRQATRGRTGSVFMLYASFILWYLLEMMAASVCQEMFGTIPSLMVQMLGSLAITVYLNTAVTAYYLGCQPRADGETEDPEQEIETGSEEEE